MKHVALISTLMLATACLDDPSLDQVDQEQTNRGGSEPSSCDQISAQYTQLLSERDRWSNCRRMQLCFNRMVEINVMIRELTGLWQLYGCTGSPNTGPYMPYPI